MNLWDYIRQNFSSNTTSPKNVDQTCLSANSVVCDISDSESECSYTDLINEYTKKTKPDTNQDNSNTDILDSVQKVESPTIDDIPENIEWELENFNGGIVAPKRFVVKWAAQLLLALEKLHSLGVICWWVAVTNFK